jgi:hypothetical protein
MRNFNLKYYFTLKKTQEHAMEMFLLLEIQVKWV